MNGDNEFPPRNASYWKRQAKEKDKEIEELQCLVQIIADDNTRFRDELLEQKPVAIAQCGNGGQWLNRTRYGMDTLRDGDEVYTKPKPSATPLRRGV